VRGLLAVLSNAFLNRRAWHREQLIDSGREAPKFL
jgi:hypothetical protein